MARPQKYPWDQWLNGETWEVRQGKDFLVTRESFRSAAQAAAKQRGKGVKTRRLSDDKGGGLVIRAYEEGAEPPWEDDRSRYPWDEWLNGETWELRRGEDFQPNHSTFRRRVYAAAERRGKRVKTWFVGDETLVIRAYEEGEEFPWEEADLAHGNTKYPWDEWLSGETWELRRGRDFLVRADHFRNTVYAAAKQRGKRAKARLVGDETLVIRAYENGA